MAKVLVTGGSGFVGAHLIVQLLAAGHEVRTTVRDIARRPQVDAMVRQGGGDPSNLTVVAADLTEDAGWAEEAVAGCAFVHHVASPFPAIQPKDADDLIVPARDGTLRVLRAARDAGVRRIVLTSSFAAIGYGHPDRPAPFDERDWTIVDAPGIPAYVQSKTIAERAAWDFVAREGNGVELAVVNPVGIFGPALDRDTSTSVSLFQAILDGKMPGIPRLWIGVVDVRDVADLHLRAMTDPAAAGERFLATGGPEMSAAEIAAVLRARLGHAARRVPTRNLPDWVVRLLGVFLPPARALADQVGRRREATNEKARRVLGWSPRANEETIVATAESLIALGMVKR